MSYLRLSEAILMGDGLRVRAPGIWLALNKDCGCAIGGALLAAGLRSTWNNNLAPFTARHYDMIKFIANLSPWPWVTEYMLTEISRLFSQVCDGDLTIEHLADQVREWEEEFDPRLRQQDVERYRAKLLARATEVFGDQHKAELWLKTATEDLDGQTPLELARDKEYDETVLAFAFERIFVRVARGIYL